MFIDTHAHIYLEEFAEDLSEMILRCEAENIKKIYMPNIDVSSIEDMWRVNAAHPQCWPMIGLHPCYVKEDYRDVLQIMHKELVERSYVAVGEVGIDLYWDKTFQEEQFIAFQYQIEMAKEAQLPIIIHSRESLDFTIDAIEKNQNGQLKGIFHCFNGTLAQAQRIMDVGFLMGIGGVVTYKNAGVDKVVAQLPLESMVLETDAPYLSPVPYRGKRNESSYLIKVAEKIAELKNCPLSEVGEKTTENSNRLFNA